MTFTELKDEVERYGGMGEGALDVASVAAGAKGGLRMMCSAAPWPWMRMAFSWNLTAGTYAYNLRDIDATLQRVDAKEFRYDGGTSYLTWATVSSIDRTLEPSWKDDGTDSGTPEYIARVGTQLWVAGKPSAAHVSSYPSVYGYGWRHENWDEDGDINGGHLLLPDDFFEAAVQCSLDYGYHEEDDARAELFMQRWLNVYKPDMLATLDPGSNDRMFVPSWAYHADNADDNYGDGS